MKNIDWSRKRPQAQHSTSEELLSRDFPYIAADVMVDELVILRFIILFVIY